MSEAANQSRVTQPQRPTAARRGLSKLSTRLIGASGSGRTSIGSPSASAPPIGSMRIQVLAARGLAARDRNGRSDPYVVVRFADSRIHSDTVRASLNPSWGTLPADISFESDGKSGKAVILDVPVHQLDQRLEVLMCVFAVSRT